MADKPATWIRRPHLVDTAAEATGAQSVYELGEEVVELGRSQAIKGIVLAHPSVDRRHAAVIREAGRYYIEDFGSREGTFVNLLPVPPHQRVMLRDGDQVFLGGEYVFLFRESEGSSQDGPCNKHDAQI
jgi:pSer/pThr/pTyr-binding forkhead associated (FHA) protein